MRTTGRRLAAALGAMSLLGPLAAAGGDEPDVVTLENGLAVTLRRTKDAKDVGVVLLFRFGRDQDPPDRRGAAELLLRLHATSAAGNRPERGLADLGAHQGRYRGRTVLYVGRDHVAFGGLLAPKDLVSEIEDIAARLGDLRVTEAGFGRIRDDLVRSQAMAYEQNPSMAAQLDAGLRARPEPQGNRPWGSTDDLTAATWEEARDLGRARLRPRHAILAIVGDFDPGGAKAAIRKHLAPLAPGDELPASPPAVATQAADAAADEPVVLRVRWPHRTAARPSSEACLALAIREAPAPADLATLLLLAARLGLRRVPDAQALLPVVRYDLLRDPAMLFLTARMSPGEEPRSAVARLRAALSEAATAPFSGKDEVEVRACFAGSLGLPLVEGSRGTEVVGSAWADARLRHLGWSGAAILAAARALKPAALKEAVERARKASAVAILEE